MGELLLSIGSHEFILNDACFDMSELPPRMFYEFGTIGYHPQAAAAAWEEIERFLHPAK